MGSENEGQLRDIIDLGIFVFGETGKAKFLSTFLGLGESSAIALALEVEGTLVILDDKNARH